jgi:hypothetical protein
MRNGCLADTNRFESELPFRWDDIKGLQKPSERFFEEKIPSTGASQRQDG